MSSDRNASAERPLDGCRVLLTRPAGRSAALVSRLAELGARVAERPTIALVPPADTGPAREAARRLGDYDWLVFTSTNGVRFFAETAAAEGADLTAIEARIAAIGPATARTLAARGLRVTITAKDSRSEGLADALRGEIREGERALLVRPEQAREVVPATLRELGVRVDGVPFYRNVAAPEAAEVAREVCGGAYDLALFSSPSTFQRLLEAAASRDELSRALGRMVLVAIGKVTAETIRDAGAAVGAVAARPTDEGIVAAVMRVAAG